MLGALLWWVRPRGEGHSQNVGPDSVIASTFKVSNTKWDWRRLFDATWFQWRKFTLTLQIIRVFGITFVHLSQSLTRLWQLILHSFIQPQNLPCFNFKDSPSKLCFNSSLPTLQTLLQFGTSPKLVWILKIKHL